MCDSLEILFVANSVARPLASESRQLGPGPEWISPYLATLNWISKAFYTLYTIKYH